MFNKKKKPNDASLAIGLHPVEVEVPEKKSNRALILLIVIVLIVLAVVVTVVVIGNQSIKHPPVSPTKGVTSGDTRIDPIPNATPSTSVAPTTATEGATTSGGTSTPTTGTQSTTKGYVVYQNDLLGLSVDYPDKWFVRENTDKAIGALKVLDKPGEKFDASATKLTMTLPVADFYPKNSANTSISMLIVSNEAYSKEVKNGVFRELIPVGTTFDKAEAAKNRHMVDYSVSSINYALTEFKNKLNCTQYAFVVGQNTFLFSVTSLSTEKSVDTDSIVQEMITSLKLSKGVVKK